MQHSTLSKRHAAGRLDEVATCVQLWLGLPASAPAAAAAQGPPVPESALAQQAAPN